MARVLLTITEGTPSIIASSKGLKIVTIDFDSYDPETGLIEREIYNQGDVQIAKQNPQISYHTDELEEVKDQFVVTWTPMDVVERSRHGLDYDEAKEILEELHPNITWEQVDDKINKKLGDANNESQESTG